MVSPPDQFPCALQPRCSPSCELSRAARYKLKSRYEIKEMQQKVACFQGINEGCMPALAGTCIQSLRHAQQKFARASLRALNFGREYRLVC